MSMFEELYALAKTATLSMILTSSTASPPKGARCAGKAEHSYGVQAHHA